MYFAVNKAKRTEAANTAAPSFWIFIAKLVEGKVFRAGTGREQLAAWAEGLGL